MLSIRICFSLKSFLTCMHFNSFFYIHYTTSKKGGAFSFLCSFFSLYVDQNWSDGPRTGSFFSEYRFNVLGNSVPLKRQDVADVELI